MRRALLRGVCGLCAVILLASGCDLEAGGQVSFLTYDGDPDWSPDGRTIAFVSSRGGGGIYVLGRDGEGLRLVMRGEADELDWSPDGRMIAFTRKDGIYVVKATGGTPRRLIGEDKAGKALDKEIGDTAQLSWPAWSPDGEQLAFVKQLPDFSSAIFVVGLDGRGSRRLLPKYRGAIGLGQPGSIAATMERDPAWSPDGREIAFQAGDGQIVAARISDGHRRVIAEEGSYEPAWSPDGRVIAYQCEGDLCVSNADGRGEARRMASDGGDPSWAPDSRRLVFEHYLYSSEANVFTGDAQSLTLLDVSNGDSEKLTYGPDLPGPARG